MEGRGQGLGAASDRVKAANRTKVTFLRLYFFFVILSVKGITTDKKLTNHPHKQLHSFPAPHCRHRHRRGGVRKAAGGELGPRPPVPRGWIELEAAAAVRQAAWNNKFPHVLFIKRFAILRKMRLFTLLSQPLGQGV